MMKLVDLTWATYRIPFRRPFLTAHGPLSQRTGALVTLCTEEGFTGIGEIAPLPDQSGANLEAALNTLPGLARALRRRELADILRFLAARSVEGQLPSPLVCGLESALLDAIGWAERKGVAELLARGYPCEEQREQRPPAAPRTRIPVNAVLGGATIEQTVEQARAAINAGFTCLKLKLTAASEASIERVAAVRAAIGPEISLRLDANEGWSFAEALHMLTRCAPCTIQYVEQPLPASDLDDAARLRRLSPIPLAADEALISLASARRILEAEAADVLILKPQLAGGLQVCRQIIQEASARNVACVLTSSLEAGVGLAAALHLAAATPEITLPCGLATLALLENNLLQESLVIERGWMGIPAGPGLGIALDEGALQHYR